MFTANEISEFYKKYWEYYLILESDFLNTEKYLTIDEDNAGAFSVEYIKIMQTVCSEIDVVAKYLCQIISPGFKRKTIDGYCKCILDDNPMFVRANTSVKQLSSKIIAPWYSWKYNIQEKKGKTTIVAENPDWWQKYNKIKHSRTTIESTSGRPYYKFANQANVLNSLAALFILESYTMTKLCANAPREICEHYLKHVYEDSKLFISFLVAQKPNS